VPTLALFQAVTAFLLLLFSLKAGLLSETSFSSNKSNLLPCVSFIASTCPIKIDQWIGRGFEERGISLTLSF